MKHNDGKMIIMRSNRLLYILMIMPVFIIGLAAAVNAETAQSAATTGPQTVREVDVRLHIYDNLPESVEQRIHTSLMKVGERALLGKPLDEANRLKSSISQVMKKIFNEVLGGFKVLDLTVDIGERSSIDLFLEPLSPQIKSVKIEIIPQGGISAEWTYLFRKRLEGVEENLTEKLSGLPVESSKWSLPLVESLIIGEMDCSTRFPGISSDMEVTIGSETTVRLMLSPASKTIRSIAVKTRSTTVPSLALERIKFNVAAHADLLIGLPVVFAKEEEASILETFHQALQDNSFGRKLRLRYEIKATMQSRTVLSVIAESEKYSGFARVKVGFGQEDRNPDIEAHLGFFPVDDTEIFSEINFFPGPIDLQFNLGIGRRLGNFYAAGGRNFIDGLNRIWLNYYITEDIVAAWEKNVVDIENEKIEGSLTFKAHDFFSFQLVTNFQEDIWIQFTVNL